MNHQGKPTQMTLLQTQEEFEILIGRQPSPNNIPIPPFIVIYFTANWCGACKKLDFDYIIDKVPGATWMKCDVDMNQYTLGFCGLRSIPSFVAIKDKKIVGMLSDNRTGKVVEWLKGFA